VPFILCVLFCACYFVRVILCVLFCACYFVRVILCVLFCARKGEGEGEDTVSEAPGKRHNPKEEENGAYPRVAKHDHAVEGGGGEALREVQNACQPLEQQEHKDGEDGGGARSLCVPVVGREG